MPITTFEEMNDTFQSFTGADIQAIVSYKAARGIGRDAGVKQKVIGTLASVTVSVVREVNPLWGMGSPDFRAVSRGKRSVSGTLSFVVLDRDPLIHGLQLDSMVLADQYLKIADPSKYTTDIAGYGINTPLTGMNRESVKTALTNLYSIIGKQKMRYGDQMAPFDVTISLINDQGAASVAAVRQIYLVSQGTGWSMHDLESDQVYSYIARFYEPLKPMTDLASAASYDATTIQG